MSGGVGDLFGSGLLGRSGLRSGRRPVRGSGCSTGPGGIRSVRLGREGSPLVLEGTVGLSPVGLEPRTRTAMSVETVNLCSRATQDKLPCQVSFHSNLDSLASQLLDPALNKILSITYLFWLLIRRSMSRFIGIASSAGRLLAQVLLARLPEGLFLLMLSLAPSSHRLSRDLVASC
jgi:hypothetical protein